MSSPGAACTSSVTRTPTRGRGEGPYIAWFKDPAGNTLSVLQEK